MIQFNLLPDVKKEYIKTKRIKRLIISVSSITSISVLVILILLFSFVQFAQKSSIADLTRDIDSELAKISSIEGLDEILTIQNQLETLPDVNENKPEVSRIIDYLKIITPQGVFTSSLDINIENNTIEIVGTADTLALINTYADTLKFATFQTVDAFAEEGEDTLVDNGDRSFSNVITSLSRNNEGASYSIEFEYDPVLFDNTKIVTIVVPDTITTRSVTGQPNVNGDELFRELPDAESGEDL